MDTDKSREGSALFEGGQDVRGACSARSLATEDLACTVSKNSNSAYTCIVIRVEGTEDARLCSCSGILFADS